MSTTGIHGEFKHLGWLGEPTVNGHEWKWGDTCFFEDHSGMYGAVSRIKKIPSGGVDANTRSIFLYKLNQDWTAFDGTVAKLEWRSREAPMMFKKDGYIYLVCSQTREWRQSYTYFKRATTVAGLAYAMEEEVIMHPANSPQVQSMGTQFNFLLEVEKDKWVFQGRRHPSEETLPILIIHAGPM